MGLTKVNMEIWAKVSTVYGYEIAKAIAQKQNRAWGVIEARVDLGRCKSLYQDSPADPKGRWREDHDSVFRRHGPWANVW